jgi:hypothetical protein
VKKGFENVILHLQRDALSSAGSGRGYLISIRAVRTCGFPSFGIVWATLVIRLRKIYFIGFTSRGRRPMSKA